MFLRQLDLTTALRPSLLPDETLLYVQDSVGLYEGKYKIPNYQDGHAYLTSHRICYVDNQEPRKFSVAIDLKDVERPEFYAGFLKSSAKVTLYPKAPKHNALAIRSPKPGYPSPGSPLASTPPSRYATPGRTAAPSPAPVRDPNATWICPICSFANPVPSNFDPSTANDRTPLPPCLACGIKPPLVHVVKAAIAALSNRSSGSTFTPTPAPATNTPLSSSPQTPMDVSLNQCPRCTFSNHPSLSSCEICGAKLSSSADRRSQIIESAITRPESPGPSLPTSVLGDTTPESVKLSFRAGGDKIFYDRLKGALVQRKWLLQNAPPIPRSHTGEPSQAATYSATDGYTPTPPPPKVVGIAGLEQRRAELRKTNEFVIGSAFEDLEALMTSAKEVIAMAERFRSQNSNNGSSNADTEDDATAEAASLLSDMGLVTTKDMLSGSGADRTYIAELSRNLAEFLTDDKRGVLKKEGGIISLVDLWALFNRTRNGIELVSPRDFDRAATMWDTLRLPIRLRRFKSGLLVVQGRDRTDDKTVASILSWLKDLHSIPPSMSNTSDFGAVTGPSVTWDWQAFGRGVTAQETAERFGWSVGVATEELEMAEERGALCREQGLDGVRFWENFFADIPVKLHKSASQLEQMEIEKRLRESGLL
ncbi:Vps36-domain-containing protein [Aureobasidium sp. EXF-10727]|nr:Vps36-domain-containing protein [Aureobasidium sp. EXF-10727]